MNISNSLFTPEMATGIDVLDHDLIALFDDLRQLATATGCVLPSSFSVFEENLLAHFTRQVELMNSVDYQAREAHGEAHEEFLTELRHQVRDVHEGVSSVGAMARLLQIRLQRHVLAQDVQLGEAITQQVGTHDRRSSGEHRPLPTDPLLGIDERRLTEMHDIEWSQRLITGIAVMDDDHHQLIKSFNEILALAKEDQRTAMEERLINLAQQMTAHFAREEGLMAGCPPDLVAAHSHEHRQLLGELSCQIDDWHDRHISAALLVRFLQRWLLRHIVAEDMALAKVISSR